MCVSCVCMHAKACKTRGVWGHAPLGNFLENRCSEIVSEAILGEKQSRSSYMAPGVLHRIFGCPCAFAKPANLEFLREKVGRTAGE